MFTSLNSISLENNIWKTKVSDHACLYLLLIKGYTLLKRLCGIQWIYFMTTNDFVIGFSCAESIFDEGNSEIMSFQCFNLLSNNE